MSTRTRFSGLGLMIMIIILLAACGSNNEESDNSDTSNNTTKTGNDEVMEITIGQDPYDYAKMPVYLGKTILEDQGYDVEVEVADVGIMFSALADGEVDVFPDIWDPNLHGSYVKKYEDDLNLIGTLYKDAPMGIAVPEYVEDVDSIADLKEHHDEFAGEIYGTEAGTGMNANADQTIEEYDLDYEQIESSTEGMLAEVVHREPNQEPIVFLAWRPHIMFEKYDIKILDDPKGVWGLDTVKVGVSPDLKDESPTAYKLFSNMNFSVKEVEEWLIKMRDSDKEVDELALEWLENNPDKAEEWLTDDAK